MKFIKRNITQLRVKPLYDESDEIEGRVLRVGECGLEALCPASVKHEPEGIFPDFGDQF